MVHNSSHISHLICESARLLHQLLLCRGPLCSATLVNLSGIHHFEERRNNSPKLEKAKADHRRVESLQGTAQ